MLKRALLLVDDDPVFLHALERILKRAPFDLFKATSAERAAVILKRYQIDCVISDYRMPGISGIDFLKWVRKHYPHTIRIILTGEANTSSAIRAINEGEVFRYLTKPVRPRILLGAIQQAFRALDRQDLSACEVEQKALQSGDLNALERMYPGITKVSRSEDGAVIFNHEGTAEEPGDYDNNRGGGVKR